MAASGLAFIDWWLCSSQRDDEAGTIITIMATTINNKPKPSPPRRVAKKSPLHCPGAACGQPTPRDTSDREPAETMFG